MTGGLGVGGSSWQMTRYLSSFKETGVELISPDRILIVVFTPRSLGANNLDELPIYQEGRRQAGSERNH